MVHDKTLVGGALLGLAGDVLPGAGPRSDGRAPGRFSPPAPAASRPVERPNVLLVTIDALRWDHATLSGYARPTTPRLASLGTRSLVFHSAYSPASTTRFSIPALLAGRPPSKVVWRRRGRNLYVVPGGTPTLASALHAAGVHTAAVLNGYDIFDRAFGIAEGWDSYDTGSVRFRSAREIDGFSSKRSADAALAALAGLASPWLLWVHFMDPHAPYDQYPGAPVFGTTEVDRYDSELAGTDAEVGRLVEAVLARPDAERTVVAVTGDHGEGFRERGILGHGRFVTEEEVHVPLVLRIPGVAPRRVTTPVCISDLTPTLLDLHGLLEPGLGFEGRNLLTVLEAPDASPPVVVETWPFAEERARRVALVEGRRKVTWEARSGAWTFTDLAADPAERGGGPALPEAEQSRLRGLLGGWLADHPLPTWR